MGPFTHGALGGHVCRAVGCLAVTAGLLAGCGPREPALVNPGMSSVSPALERPTPKTADAATKWEAMGEVAGLRRAGGTFVSRGHFAGRWKAETRANSEAETVYANLVPTSRFPGGALLVQMHRNPGSGIPGPIFSMLKRDPGFFPEGGDWEYLVTDSEGWIEDRGPLALCARCHAEAKADWVFPLPKDK
jgi:hypothetical protein